MIRLGLTVLTLITLTTAAMGHSPLQRTAPVDGAVVASVPVELSLVFGRDIRLTRIEWRLDGQTGLVDLSPVKGFATEFVLPFNGAGPGVYQIEWRGLGDDGHPQSGSFGFTVE